MNAINLYIQTCRYVMQAQAHDSSTWEDLYRYLPYLRQALSCCVCSNIIQCPMGPINSKCQHHVCRECCGGKMRLRPSCSWCKNWQEYVENNQLRLIVQCFKKLCDYLASSVIAQHLRNNNSTSDNNSLLSIITEGRTVTDDYSFSPSGPSAIPCLLPSKISATSNGTSLVAVPVKQEPVGISTGSSSGDNIPQLHDLEYNLTTASIKNEDCDDVTDTNSTLHTTLLVPDDTQLNHALLSPVLETEEPATVTSTSGPEPLENITDNIVTSSSVGVMMPNKGDRGQQQSSVDSVVAGVDEGVEAGDEEEENEDEDEASEFGPQVITEQNGVFIHGRQLEEPEEEEMEEEDEEDEEDGEIHDSELVVIAPRIEHIGHLEHSKNLTSTVSAAVSVGGGVSISGVVSVSGDIYVDGEGQPLSCSSSEAASSSPNSLTYESSYVHGGQTMASSSEHDYNNKDTYTGIYSVSMSNDHAPKLKIRRTSYILGPDHHNPEPEPSHLHHHHQEHRSSGSGSTREHKQKSRSKPTRQKTKLQGCRCGLATPTPGKLTCCGQRCPCYSAFKGCLLECRCRGCRNPRKVHGIGSEVPKLTISREEQDDEEDDTEEEVEDEEDSDVEVDV